MEPSTVSDILGAPPDSKPCQASLDIADIASDIIVDYDGPLEDIEPESAQNSPSKQGLAVARAGDPTTVAELPPKKLFQRPSSSEILTPSVIGFEFSAAIKPQTFVQRPLYGQSKPLASVEVVKHEHDAQKQLDDKENRGNERLHEIPPRSSSAPNLERSNRHSGEALSKLKEMKSQDSVPDHESVSDATKRNAAFPHSFRARLAVPDRSRSCTSPTNADTDVPKQTLGTLPVNFFPANHQKLATERLIDQSREEPPVTRKRQPHTPPPALSKEAKHVEANEGLPGEVAHHSLQQFVGRDPVQQEVAQSVALGHSNILLPVLKPERGFTEVSNPGNNGFEIHESAQKDMNTAVEITSIEPSRAAHINGSTLPQPSASRSHAPPHSAITTRNETQHPMSRDGLRSQTESIVRKPRFTAQHQSKQRTVGPNEPVRTFRPSKVVKQPSLARPRQPSTQSPAPRPHARNKISQPSDEDIMLIAMQRVHKLNEAAKKDQRVREAMEDKINQLETTIYGQEAALEQAENRYRRLRTDADQQKHALEDFKSRFSQLRTFAKGMANDHQVLKQEGIYLRSEQAKVLKGYDNLRWETRACLNVAGELMESRAVPSNRLGQIRSDIANLEASLTVARESLTSKNDLLNEEKQKNARLEQHIVNYARRQDEQTKVVQGQQAEMSNDIGLIVEQLTAFDKTIEDSVKDERLPELNKCIELVHSFCENNHTKSQDLEHLQSTVATLCRNLESHFEKAQTTEETISALNNCLDSRITDHVSNVSILLESLRPSSEETANLHDTKARLEERLKYMEEKAATSLQQYVDTVAKEEVLNKACSDLRTQLAILQQQAMDPMQIQLQCQEYTNTITRLKDDIQEKNRLLTVKEGEVKQKEAESSSTQGLVNDLRNNNSSLETQLASAKEEKFSADSDSQAREESIRSHLATENSNYRKIFATEREQQKKQLKRTQWMLREEKKKSKVKAEKAIQGTKRVLEQLKALELDTASQMVIKQNRIDEVEALLLSMSNERLASQNEAARLRSLCDEQRGNLESARETCANAMHGKSTIESELASLNEELQKAGEIREEVNRVPLLLEDLKLRDATITELQAQTANSETLRQSLVRIRGDITGKEEELSSLRQRLGTAESIASEVQSMEASIRKQNDQITNLKRELAASVDTRKKLEEFQHLSQQREREIVDLKERLTAAQELGSQLVSPSSAVQQKDEELKQLEKTLESTRKTLQELQQLPDTIRHKEKDITDLKHNLTVALEAASKVQQLRKDLEDKDEGISVLSLKLTQRAESDQEIAWVRNALKGKGDEVEALRLQLEQAEETTQSVSSLQREAEQHAQDFLRLSQELDEAKKGTEQMIELKRAIEERDQELSALKKIVAGLSYASEQVRRLEDDIDSKDVQLAALHQELAEEAQKTDQIAILEEAVGIRDHELTVLKDRLASNTQQSEQIEVLRTECQIKDSELFLLRERLAEIEQQSQQTQDMLLHPGVPSQDEILSQDTLTILDHNMQQNATLDPVVEHESTIEVQVAPVRPRRRANRDAIQPQNLITSDQDSGPRHKPRSKAETPPKARNSVNESRHARTETLPSQATTFIPDSQPLEGNGKAMLPEETPYEQPAQTRESSPLTELDEIVDSSPPKATKGKSSYFDQNFQPAATKLWEGHTKTANAAKQGNAYSTKAPPAPTKLVSDPQVRDFARSRASGELLGTEAGNEIASFEYYEPVKVPLNDHTSSRRQLTARSGSDIYISETDSQGRTRRSRSRRSKTPVVTPLADRGRSSINQSNGKAQPARSILKDTPKPNSAAKRRLDSYEETDSPQVGSTKRLRRDLSALQTSTPSVHKSTPNMPTNEKDQLLTNAVISAGKTQSRKNGGSGQGPTASSMVTRQSQRRASKEDQYSARFSQRI